MTTAVVILSIMLVITLIAALSFYRKAHELRLDLTGANFEYATFNDCCFKNTNLSEVNFSYAGFWECTLEGAICDRTDFYYSSLVACNMRNAKLLMFRNLLMAVFGNLYDAVLPVNFIPACPR